MSAPANKSDIDLIASQWAAKEDLRPLAIGEEEALELWLQQDVRHLGAYSRAKAALIRAENIASHVNRGDLIEGANNQRSFAPVTATVPQPDDYATERHRIARRQLLLGGIAAATLGVIGTAWITSDRLLVTGHQYETAHGEIRVIPLEDGSVLTLNTASKVQVSLGEKRRDIRLIAGEAFFKVAKDHSRPFIVNTGERLVQAVGTAFSVRSFDDAVRVRVREGRIRYDRLNPVAGGAPLFANANMEIVDRRGEKTPSIRAMDAAELEQSLAWLEANLSFNETSLQEAALEFRRYSDMPILLAPGVDHMRITGRYPASDPAGFAEAAAQVLDLRAEQTAQGVKLSRRE